MQTPPQRAPRSPLHTSPYLLLALLLTGLTACGGDDPVPTTLVDFPGAGEVIPGLWRPAGIAISHTGDIFVAEQASRRVRVLHPDGTLETLADVVPDRPGIPSFVEHRFDLDFGLELALLDEDALVIASRGAPLLLLSPNTKRTVVPTVGHLGPPGRAPQAGVLLEELDCTHLKGFALAQDRTFAVLAIGDQLWRAVPASPPLTAESFPLARLELLAGDGTRGVADTVSDATTAPLHLGEWIGLVIGQDPPNDVFFIEDDTIRLVREGRLVALTGQGSLSGSSEIPLADFSSRFGTRTHGVWDPFHQTACFLDHTIVRRLHIESVDLETGASVGHVVPVAPFGITELTGLAANTESLFLSHGWAGSILSYDWNDNEFAALIGPTNARERYLITPDEPGPYQLDALMLPQAIVSIGAGEIVLANQPLARLITSIDRTTEANDTEDAKSSITTSFCSTPKNASISRW